ncbi:uncharacterized protein LOC117123684 [Anneissia japonica]|uniref:uncharacterized protein LOC117123684 n=1 Tax=Anneissia japonica TaxID=1529436 RepID=UPI0014257167|nr:uncharacterized protein LOC117123684 [Anneissia japonica]
MASLNQTHPTLSDNEMSNVMESTNSKTTTKLIIQNAVRVFTDYIMQKADLQVKTVADCYTVSIAELDEVLTRFYAEVRQRNGEIYMKKSMISLRYGLQRHFVTTRNVDVINDARFRPSNQMFCAVLARLKQDGKDIVRHKQPITLEDRQKMYDQNILGTDNPTCLQRKVFFDLIFHLCKKGREDLHVMKRSDFQVSIDNNGSRFVHQTASYLRRNHLDDRDARMYELVGDRLCPVKSFMKYISKLSPRNPNMWQRPKQGVVGENYPIWYLNVNMGHNALGSMMRNISIAANLSQIYTNQCIRATSNLELDRKWYEFREMMSEDQLDKGMKRRISWNLSSSVVPRKQANRQPPSCEGKRSENVMQLRNVGQVSSQLEASIPVATPSLTATRSPFTTASPISIVSSMSTRLPMATTSPRAVTLPSELPIASSMATTTQMEATSLMLPASQMMTTTSIAVPTLLMTTTSPDVHIKEEMVEGMLNPLEYIGDQVSGIKNTQVPDPNNKEFEEHRVITELQNSMIEETRPLEKRLMDEPSRSNAVGIGQVNSVVMNDESCQLYVDEAFAGVGGDAVRNTHKNHTEALDTEENDFCPLNNSSVLLNDDEESMEEREDLGIKAPFKRLTERHFIAVNKGRTPLGHPSKPQCIVCSNPAVKRHRTEFICEQCILPMCPIPCFKRYHTMAEYKAKCSYEYHNS